MAEAKEHDETQYELDVGDAEETEVEIPEAPEATEASEADGNEQQDDQEGREHEEYSASVKKRIDRLTKKMREAERQREEALRYAQGVQSEAEQMRQRMQQLDQGYLTEYGGRLTLEQQQVEAELRRAVEMGDAEATVQAQRKLTNLAIAANQYETVRNRQAQPQPQPQQQWAPQPQPQQAPQPQRPDPKAEQWAEKNSWFGQDEAMTFAAFGIHKKLVESEGFDPQSDEYYSELDKRIRKEFPQKFPGTNKRAAQTVAGVSRTTSNGRTRVKLSPSQVAIAKKLGVPLEEYAKYVKG